MFALIIVFSIIDLVVGIVVTISYIATPWWYVGPAIILSSLAMMWLAGGAHAAYRRDEKVRKGIDYLGLEYKAEQERFLQALCNKLNVSYDEIKGIADIEAINSKKDISLDELPCGSKVVLKVAKEYRDGQIFKPGTVGVIISHLSGENDWQIMVIDGNGNDCSLSCEEYEIENYYLYQYKKFIFVKNYKDELEEEIRKKENAE